jgi:sugar lactone lactonase YvrE
MSLSATRLRILFVAGLFVISAGFLAAAPTIGQTTVFAKGGDVNGTGPDSIAASPTSLWVAYTNGADSTGKSGSSNVVQYDYTGKVLTQTSVPGYVDGLKYDDERGLIWILVNQDGNSVLTVIDSSGKSTTLAYAVTSDARGYDDIVFINGAIFMSYTNPTVGSDPIIQYMTGVNPVTFATVLTMGGTGTNLATQQSGQAITQTDPDSMKATPFGGLMLSSGADGQITFVHDLALTTRSVSFLNILDPSTGKNISGLDDAVFATTPQGTFYVTDTGNNQVLKVTTTGLTPMSLFASAGSMNAVISVDMKTGNATPFISTANGANLKAPHGLAFVPSFNSLFGH